MIIIRALASIAPYLKNRALVRGTGSDTTQEFDITPAGIAENISSLAKKSSGVEVGSGLGALGSPTAYASHYRAPRREDVRQMIT